MTARSSQLRPAWQSLASLQAELPWVALPGLALQGLGQLELGQLGPRLELRLGRQALALLELALQGRALRGWDQLGQEPALTCYQYT
eukprot:CAMPEP_0185606466 /NCGR_PEP_ID=MMETSP0436-20130131/4794_1 /TAXON_ID=626734 ORGANISM="Favella taraikaensis, Strain Fe Narragansett Bay" /NCGR_SAMPLE_ID=MMETSP0436 /ASSEMBLY_ACC=CAM_ASM_000390 /LENGTH=86 /DNA_ID=CAMNT_0028238029 /DNA_START=525 /DNA_END=786 /DNA_ORIENTATION=-